MTTKVSILHRDFRMKINVQKLFPKFTPKELFLTSKQVKLYCWNAFEENVWEELLVIAIDNLLVFFVQKSTANWLRTFIFLKTKVLSWLVKVGGYFGLKAVTDKIGQN